MNQRAFSLRQAARVAGAAYIITGATAVFAEFFVRSTLIAGGDAARTANNIVANAQLFRVGIVCDLLTWAGVIVLNLALFELLAPVHRSLALLAAFWRLAEASVYGAITVSSFLVLALLTGPDYVQAFEPHQLQALARLLLGAHSSGYVIGMVFFGFGGTTYGYLLVRSRYVPTALALFGVAASVLVLFCLLAGILSPAFAAAVTVMYWGPPIFIFEVTLGLWLLVKGVRIPEHR